MSVVYIVYGENCEYEGCITGNIKAFLEKEKAENLVQQLTLEYQLFQKELEDAQKLIDELFPKNNVSLETRRVNLFASVKYEQEHHTLSTIYERYSHLGVFDFFGYDEIELE